LLAVEDLHLAFVTEGRSTPVLDGVTLEVAAGEIVALVGETGCGKSLTARAILRLVPPSARITRGRILYRGRDLLALDEREFHGTIRGREIALVLQDPFLALNQTLSIGQQVDDVLRLRAGAGAGRASDTHGRHREAAALLARVRLPDPEALLSRYPFELSGGMRQRVLIALALARGPRLLIADEPATALDVSTQEQLLLLFRALRRDLGLSLIYITHDLAVAREISDRIYVLYAGQTAEAAPTSQLFAEPLHPYAQGLLASVPRFDGSLGAGIPGTVPDYTETLPPCRFAPRCAHRMSICLSERPTRTKVALGHHVYCHLYPPT
jgi:oligopeptide/dipeptide ABC transporter ATP-binding protein